MNWIKVSERLPDNGASVIAGTTKYGGEVCQARYKPRLKKWVFPSAAMSFEVTHWQPLPEPPKD